MIKKFKRVGMIEAELFDGSDEMIEKYFIEKNIIAKGLVTVYTIQGLDIDIGDWIIKNEYSFNGYFTVLRDKLFNSLYVEVTE